MQESSFPSTSLLFGFEMLTACKSFVSQQFTQYVLHISLKSFDFLCSISHLPHGMYFFIFICYCSHKTHMHVWIHILRIELWIEWCYWNQASLKPKIKKITSPSEDWTFARGENGRLGQVHCPNRRHLEVTASLDYRRRPPRCKI